LNNAGRSAAKLLIILNDNGMSISKPQGPQPIPRARARQHHLRRIKKTPSASFMNAHRRGHSIEQFWHHFRTA